MTPRIVWSDYSQIAPQTSEQVRRKSNHDFEQALERVLETDRARQTPVPEPEANLDIRFSKHAKSRLESRGIELMPEELQQLEGAFEQLSSRGAKESLVLMGDRAFVVGVPQRTVITVVDRAEALGTVFTNIDSTFVAS